MLVSKKIPTLDKKSKHSELWQIAESLMKDPTLVPKNIVPTVQKAIAAAEKLQEKELLQLLNLRFSKYWLRIQNYSEAKEYAKTALELATTIGGVETIASARINLATICFNKKEFNDSLSLLTKALNEHVPHQKIDIYSAIGGLYITMQKYDMALEYYQKAKKIVKGTNDLKYAALYVNTGLVLCFLEKYDEATENINTALRLFTDVSKHKYPRAICFANLADIKFAQREYTESIDCLQKAIKLYEELQIPEATLNALYLLARSHIALKEHISAYEILKKALQTFEKDNYLRLYIEALKLIVSVTKELNKLKECIDYQDQLIELQSEYFYPEKKEKIDALLDKKEKEIDILVSKNQKIAKQNQQLLQYNKELEQYAFIIAHDLKEPLCNISGFASLLKKQNKQQFDLEALNFLQYIESGAERMHQLLEDLLQYSTLSLDTNKLQNTPLPKIIQEVFEECKQTCSLPQAQLVIKDALPTFHAEPKHIEWLFRQLIENALKFSYPDRECRIEIGTYEQDKKTFIEVKDNGIGIKKAHQQKIFRIFQRLNKENYDGTGIGLAMCKKIVELYEGEIGIESNIGVGTRVYFCLGVVGS
ncbi:MAG: tetratricopeptide repeat protein [Chitinophagales bacterium]